MEQSSYSCVGLHELICVATDMVWFIIHYRVKRLLLAN